MGITTQLTHAIGLATLPQHDKKIPALKSCNEEQKSEEEQLNGGIAFIQFVSLVWLYPDECH
jgi:hypothetical protein